MTALVSQFATIGDYYAFKGAVVPNPMSAADELEMNADLVRATNVVKRQLRLAHYQVGDDGWPTSQDIKTAFIQAACAQLDWFITTGDITGAYDKYDTVTMAGVTLSHRPSRSTASDQQITAQSRVAPEMVDILMSTVGLFTTRVKSPIWTLNGSTR